MRVTKVTVQRTIQVKKFEPELIAVTVKLDKGDSVHQAVEYARNTAYEGLLKARLIPKPGFHQEPSEAYGDGWPGGF